MSENDKAGAAMAQAIGVMSAPDATPGGCDVAIVMLGTNDVGGSVAYDLSAAQWVANLTTIRNTLVANGCRKVMIVVPLHAMTIEQLRQVMAIVVEDHDGETLRDYVTIEASFSGADLSAISVSITIPGAERDVGGDVRPARPLPAWVGEAFVRLHKVARDPQITAAPR